MECPIAPNTQRNVEPEKSSDGARGDSAGLLQTVFPSAELAAGLVEPGLDPLVPVLTEMGIAQHLVASRRHFTL